MTDILTTSNCAEALTRASTSDHRTGEDIILDVDVTHAGQIAEFSLWGQPAQNISSCRMECDLTLDGLDATSLPWRMIPTRSQTFSTSGRTWDERRWCALVLCFGQQIVEFHAASAGRGRCGLVEDQQLRFVAMGEKSPGPTKT